MTAMTLDMRDKTRWNFPLCRCGCGQKTRRYGASYLREHLPRIPIDVRLWRKVERQGKCWVWTGATTEFGYGQIGRGGRYDGIDTTHRVSWELANGPIPNGLSVLHRCDNPPCVRPEHLFLGTAGDNARDMASKGRAVTKFGVDHPFSRLSDAQVLEIVGRRRAGEKTVTLAAEFGVTSQYVGQLAAGKVRRHLTNPTTKERAA